jgi:hypothetical protein
MGLTKSPKDEQFTESSKKTIDGRRIVILRLGMFSVYLEQMVNGRTLKYDDVQNDLGQMFKIVHIPSS